MDVTVAEYIAAKDRRDTSWHGRPARAKCVRLRELWFSTSS